MKKNIFIATFFLLAISSFAQADNGAKASVKLFPMGDFVADIKGLKGSVTVTNGNYTAKDITLDLTTLKSGLELRDNHAKDKYLEVKKFPTAILLEASGTNGKGTGKLKLKDKVNPVSGTYKINGQSLVAEFTIKLSDYGINEINYKGVGVEDEVKIQVTAPIVAAAVPPAAAAGAPTVGKKPVKAPAKPQPKKKN